MSLLQVDSFEGEIEANQMKAVVADLKRIWGRRTFTIVVTNIIGREVTTRVIRGARIFTSYDEPRYDPVVCTTTYPTTSLLLHYVFTSKTGGEQTGHFTLIARSEDYVHDYKTNYMRDHHRLDFTVPWVSINEAPRTCEFRTKVGSTNQIVMIIPDLEGA